LIKLICIFIFFPTLLFSIEVECKFEEVYSSGDIQQGGLLIKEDMLRYEYFSKDLYTIILKMKNQLLIDNDTKIVQQISDNKELIDILHEVLSSYPNINEEYINEEFIIKITKSSSNFIQRISIQSPSIAMSLNLHSCIFKEINKKYFNHFDFLEYPY
jgi:hypothetical protein